MNKYAKILDFYIKSDELKNKILDAQYNYSVADNLYGSMILATALNSEFKETNNISKVYRMLFLDEFKNLHPNYDLKRLKLGNQYEQEILEARDRSNKDASFAFKCKILDVLLTKLIREKENRVSNEELIKEGSNFIAVLFARQPRECEEIFQFYQRNFKLKDKERSGWNETHWDIQSSRIETVSEHVIGVFSFALAACSELGYHVDNDKILKMIIIHEIGESIIGDITPFDGITPEEKKEMEHKAMRKTLGNLKEKENLLALLFEFDGHKTPEAICAMKDDKIDADIKSKLYQDQGMHKPIEKQKNNVVFQKAKVQEMLRNGAKEPFDIWYEWDKSIYEGDTRFPEYFELLKIVKENNLLHLETIDRKDTSLKADLLQRLSDLQGALLIRVNDTKDYFLRIRKK